MGRRSTPSLSSCAAQAVRKFYRGKVTSAHSDRRALAETVGRHRHQHRALDARGIGRACRRGARSYPHPDSRRQKPRQGARAAYGPTPTLSNRCRRKSHTAARRGRYAARTRPHLQCRHIHHSPRHVRRVSSTPPATAPSIRLTLARLTTRWADPAGRRLDSNRHGDGLPDHAPAGLLPAPKRCGRGTT
jgi:hypothetical protein